MLVNIWAYGTALSSIVAPLFAFWNPSMADRKPASSLSVPQVVNFSELEPLGWSEAALPKPHRATSSGADIAPAALRKRRLAMSASGLSS